MSSFSISMEWKEKVWKHVLIKKTLQTEACSITHGCDAFACLLSYMDNKAFISQWHWVPNWNFRQDFFLCQCVLTKAFNVFSWNISWWNVLLSREKNKNWRAVPLKSLSTVSSDFTPLANCKPPVIQPRTAVWQISSCCLKLSSAWRESPSTCETSCPASASVLVLILWHSVAALSHTSVVMVSGQEGERGGDTKGWSWLSVLRWTWRCACGNGYSLPAPLAPLDWLTWDMSVTSPVRACELCVLGSAWASVRD